MSSSISLDLASFAEMFNTTVGAAVAAIVILSIWSIVWKGWALWVASHKEEKGWFVALLVLNTLGILEIIYLFALGKRKK
jgi:methionyl-tRNA synthetase